MKRIASLTVVAALFACAPFACAQQAPVREITKIAGQVYLSSSANCMPASEIAKFEQDRRYKSN